MKLVAIAIITAIDLQSKMLWAMKCDQCPWVGVSQPHPPFAVETLLCQRFQYVLLDSGCRADVLFHDYNTRDKEPGLFGFSTRSCGISVQVATGHGWIAKSGSSSIKRGTSGRRGCVSGFTPINLTQI